MMGSCYTYEYLTTWRIILCSFPFPGLARCLHHNGLHMWVETGRVQSSCIIVLCFVIQIFIWRKLSFIFEITSVLRTWEAELGGISLGNIVWPTLKIKVKRIGDGWDIAELAEGTNPTPRPQEVEAGESSGHSWLHKEFVASLWYRRHCLNSNTSSHKQVNIEEN